MKSWLNLESVVESRTLSPVVVMAISEHRPMLTAITRYVHTEKETNSTSDYIFFASGTGTTQAGLVCGQIMHGDEREIVGVSIARKNPRGRLVVLDSVKEYLCDDVADELIESATIFIDDYIGDGYGKQNEAIKTTIKNMLSNHGIPMDSSIHGQSIYRHDGLYRKTRDKKQEHIVHPHRWNTVVL